MIGSDQKTSKLLADKLKKRGSAGIVLQDVFPNYVHVHPNIRPHFFSKSLHALSVRTVHQTCLVRNYLHDNFLGYSQDNILVLTHFLYPQQ